MILNEDLIDDFENNLDEDSANFIKNSLTDSEDSDSEVEEEDLLVDEIENEIMENHITDEVEAWQQHSTVMRNKYEEDLNVFTVANKLANVIIHLESNNILPEDITDEIDNDILSDNIKDFNGETPETTDEQIETGFDEHSESRDSVKKKYWKFKKKSGWF